MFVNELYFTFRPVNMLSRGGFPSELAEQRTKSDAARAKQHELTKTYVHWGLALLKEPFVGEQMRGGGRSARHFYCLWLFTSFKKLTNVTETNVTTPHLPLVFPDLLPTFLEEVNNTPRGLAASYFVRQRVTSEYVPQSDDVRVVNIEFREKYPVYL